MASILSGSKRYQNLQKRMQEYGIYENDIKESFIHAQGPGGQNVNKVATCVQLQHKPTNTQIKCQEYRTQLANRYKARELLLAKIRKTKEIERKKIKNAQEKIRRQKRKRSKKSKEQMLENKRKQSEKKKLRKTVDVRKADQE